MKILFFVFGLFFYAQTIRAEHQDPPHTRPVNEENRPIAPGETDHFIIRPGTTDVDMQNFPRVVERLRAQIVEKWFGNDRLEGEDIKTNVYLYSSGTEYSRATNIAATSPGHSQVEMAPNTRRMTGRRIYLRTDHLNWLATVLPHELTHTIMAGQFGQHHIPRWADEGMACLSEAEETLRQHRQRLSEAANLNELFPVRELMSMENYPERRISTFYAQSTLLVDFLVHERDHRTFIAFLRDGLDNGMEAALQRHYRWNFRELQNEWDRHVRGLVPPRARQREIEDPVTHIEEISLSRKRISF